MGNKIKTTNDINTSTEEGKLLQAALSLLGFLQNGKSDEVQLRKLYRLVESPIVQDRFYLQIGYSDNNILWFADNDGGSANLGDSIALTNDEAIEVSKGSSYNTLWPCEYVHSLMSVTVDHRPMDLSKRKW